MNKEEFLKELSNYLKKLTDEAREEELKKYANLKNYNLNPLEEANKIYASRGIKYEINKNISFYNAVETFINTMRSKDPKKIQNLIFFFIYLFLLLIFIKIPFIYVRDIISSLLNPIFASNPNLDLIWGVIIEILYAITTIILFIKLIKNKALEYEKNEQ